MSRYKNDLLTTGKILRECSKCHRVLPLTEENFYKRKKEYITKKGNRSIVSTFFVYCKDCYKQMANTKYQDVSHTHTIVDQLNLILEKAGIDWGKYVREWNMKKGWYDAVKKKFVVRENNSTRKGKKHSIETRKKMSEIAIAKGRKLPLIALQNASKTNKGRKCSIETKRKISEAHKNKKCSKGG